MPKVSIIIPVYNVEDYLCECVNSIISQELTDIEIILVDDGSTDLSGKMCDDFAKIDSRVRVIHKENGGLSSARNAGIDICKGDYVGFVDSDDVVSKEMFFCLYELSQELSADIAICSYSKFTDTVDFPVSTNNDYEVLNHEIALKELFKGEKYFVTSWDKIYKRELFNDIRFPNGKIHEDMFTTYKLFDLSNTVVYTKKILYGYRIRKNSITNTSFSEKRFDNLEAIDEIIDYFKKDYSLSYILSNLAYEKSLYLLNLILLEKSIPKQLKFYSLYRDYIINHRKMFSLRFQNDPQKLCHIKKVCKSRYLYFFICKHEEKLLRFSIKRILSKLCRLFGKGVRNDT